jgi:hypothetical protein
VVFARRHVGRILVALSAALLALPAGGAAAAPPTATGFVSRQGTQLELNGKPWNFAGYNLSCQQPFLMSTAQLEYYFQDIEANSGGNVVRMWWFQSDLGTGSSEWAPFDQVAAAAQATGMRLIITLTNQWQTCDEPNPSTAEKDLTWYQGGYEQPEGGYTLSYKDFATQMAAHFASNPAIAFWQLVNEAEVPTITASGGTCDEPAAASALRSFGDNMTLAIKQVDPNHLVDLGTMGAGECGTVGTDYSYVHAGNVDMCEVHDYTNPAIPMATGPNSLSEDVSECKALNKPIFIGEAGIPGDVQPDGSSGSAAITTTTLDQRAAFFKAKIDTANADGVDGYVIWFKSPFYTLADNNLDIPDGDPTQGVLADAVKITASPAASMPELPWGGVAVLAAAGIGGAMLAGRRRKLRRSA